MSAAAAGIAGRRAPLAGARAPRGRAPQRRGRERRGAPAPDLRARRRSLRRAGRARARDRAGPADHAGSARPAATCCGVISLRGEILQVIDLRLRLRLRAAPTGRASRIVVVHAADGGVAGLLVDEVTRGARRPRGRRCAAAGRRRPGTSRRCASAATASSRWSTSNGCCASMHNTDAGAIGDNRVTLGCFEVGGHTYAIDVVAGARGRALAARDAAAQRARADRGRDRPARRAWSRSSISAARWAAPPVDAGPRARIAVTEVDGLVMGLAVDAAVEVLSVDVADARRSAGARDPDRLRRDARRGPPAGRRADPGALARARARERLPLRALREGGRRMTQSALPTRSRPDLAHARAHGADPAARRSASLLACLFTPARAHARAVACGSSARWPSTRVDLHGSDHGVSNGAR